MLKGAQTESDVRSLDEVSPWTPSIASRATYELTPLRMLQVMQQERACGTGQISHLVRVQLPRRTGATRRFERLPETVQRTSKVRMT
jgi:hypothetical protein